MSAQRESQEPRRNERGPGYRLRLNPGYPGYTSGSSFPSSVGMSSVTVGWMCIARWITV